MKKILIITGSVIGSVVAICAILIAIGYNKYMTIEATAIDPQVTVYRSGGGNSLVLVSKNGDSALVVDSKMGSAAEKMRKNIRARDIVVINTHAHQDHTGGNKLYPGAYFIAGAYTRDQWSAFSNGVHFPDETVAVGQTKTINLGGETVHIRNMGVAHTPNDLVAYFESRKLLMTGDLVFLDMHPALFPEKGTVVAKWIDALDTVLKAYDANTVIPGHGPVSTMAGVKSMRDYFASIRDALGNEATLAELRKKYHAYYALPGMSSFDITVKTITAEKKQ